MQVYITGTPEVTNKLIKGVVDLLNKSINQDSLIFFYSCKLKKVKICFYSIESLISSIIFFMS